MSRTSSDPCLPEREDFSVSSDLQQITLTSEISELATDVQKSSHQLNGSSRNEKEQEEEQGKAGRLNLGLAEEDTTVKVSACRGLDLILQ